MNREQLKSHIMDRFGVSPVEAERLVHEEVVKAGVIASVAAGRKHLVIADDDVDFNEDPAAWRQEVQKRMMAIEIMEAGSASLKEMQKLLKRIIEAEQKLIGKKTAKVNSKDEDWWDMQHSGWAMGGREMFAQKLFDVMNSLDESKLASYIMDKIGFKRSIPIDEDDIPPLVPNDLEPGQDVPAYEETPPHEEPDAPRDAEDVEAMIIAGANNARKTRA